MLFRYGEFANCFCAQGGLAITHTTVLLKRERFAHIVVRGRCSLRRRNFFQTFGPPPLIRYLPSGLGQRVSLTADSCNAATVQFDETQDRLVDLRETLARTVVPRQVEEQVAVLNV